MGRRSARALDESVDGSLAGGAVPRQCLVSLVTEPVVQHELAGLRNNR
jgi:hypothetical protein